MIISFNVETDCIKRSNSDLGVNYVYDELVTDPLIVQADAEEAGDPGQLSAGGGGGPGPGGQVSPESRGAERH